MYDLPDNRGVKLYPALIIHVNMIIRRYPMVSGKKSTKLINNMKYYNNSWDKVIDQHIPLTHRLILSLNNL